MEKRPPFPLPALLSAPGASVHQRPPPRPPQEQCDPALEPSLLLLLSAAHAPSNAVGSGRPLPPVQALPLRAHLQPQQHPSVPLLPLMFVPPPPFLPQPTRRKRILPRIVAADPAEMTGRAPPVPMPTRHPPPAVATSSPVTAPANTVVQLDSTVAEEDEAPPKKKRVRIKTDRRREQCRANQARYRNKQRGVAVSLEERVEQLRAEVGLLEHQRQLQTQCLDTSLAPMQTVMEYFRLFRYGMASSDNSADAVQQLAFVRSFMVPDLRYGDVRGVDGLMEQWRRYSRYHGELTFELESAFSVEKAAAENDRASYTIHATATLTLTVTQATVEQVFPHIRLGELKTKLLGERVRYPCSLVFEFDERDKVQALVCSIDYVASLQQVLGNVLDVAELLANARIRNDFFLLDEDEEL